MTNTQHTPGPWAIEPDALGESSIVTDNGGTIADVYGRNPANARLIAAAPDLLAALQAVADYWAGGDVPADIDAAMRAAIAKATGK